MSEDNSILPSVGAEKWKLVDVVERSRSGSNVRERVNATDCTVGEMSSGLFTSGIEQISVIM